VRGTARINAENEPPNAKRSGAQHFQVFLFVFVFLWYNAFMIITDEQEKQIAEVAKNHKLALLVLFGSRARKDARKNSDFDIAYSSISPMDLSEENQMAVELHSVFKTIKVDIVNLSNASPLLLKKIVDEAVVLYEVEESLFNNLYLYAQRIFRESAFLNKLRMDFVFNRINQYKKDVA
jgi:predicted nucleotidyltransferase